MAFTARRRQPATVRVASLDVQHSHRRSAVVLGPVTMPSLDELAAIAPPGLEVRGPMALGAARGAASDAAALEQFYVAALVRP